MRDGGPLPGSTPAAVLSQLAHRVFGPLRPDRVRVMLDFHGLALGAVLDEAGRWRAPAGRAVAVRDQALRREVADRTVTRTGMTPTWCELDTPTATPTGGRSTLTR